PSGSDVAQLVQEAYQRVITFDNSGAAAKARQAIARDPKNARAHAILGDARASLDDVAEAEKELKIALELDPSSGLAYAGYGDLYLTKDKPEEAEKAFR